MLRHCTLLSKVKSAYECRSISTCPKVFKDIGNGGNNNDNNAAEKLNALLLSLGKEDKTTAPEALKVQVPKPRSKHRMKKADKVTHVQKNLGSRIVEAAKDVANNIEGDKKEIEAQLLHKLLYKDSPVKAEILNASSGNQTLDDLLSKMDVEREEKKPQVTKDDFSRAAQVKNLIGRRSFKDKSVPRREQRVNLFGEKPLGIFDANVCKDKGIQLKTWNACEERERKLSVTHPPSNYFEQMIDWTEKGVVWKFPIDNEQGLEAEKNVSFASHVLLESHLDGWCPTAGPIRHFLELVCVGLSRNHWLSAAEKEQHLLWYKDFFTQRRKLIKELGAGEIPQLSDANTSA